MSAHTLEEQLPKYLLDAHAIEEQGLVQLRRAPSLAGDQEVAELFRRHLQETAHHERTVRDALAARGASPTAIKEAVMRAGGVGFVLFARLQPDTPAKLATHAYSYEQLEVAGYELLGRVAELADEPDIVRLARSIGAQERRMGERLAGCFDLTTAAALDGRDPGPRLPAYLTDAHAIEAQSITLLERAQTLIVEPELAEPFAEHLEESRRHMRRVETYLDEVGGSRSLTRDAAMHVGALDGGMFFQAHPDTPGKLVAFAFAFEHLEIGCYEHLRRVARAAGAEGIAQGAEEILVEERAAAGSLSSHFDAAAAAALEAAGAGSGG